MRPEPKHRAIFFAYYGEGPFVCHHCETEVTRDVVIIHHLDHNHGNNDPENLSPMHHPCHTAHHKPWLNVDYSKVSAAMKNRFFSEDHRRKISEALKGRPVSEETRKKISETSKKIPHSVRMQMVASQRGKKLSPEHIEAIRRGNLGKKRSEETKAKMREAAKNRVYSEEGLAGIRAGQAARRARERGETQ